MFVIGASFAAFAAFLPKHKAAAQGSGQQPRIRPTPRPTPPPTAQSMFAPLAGVVSPAGAEVAINNNGPENRVVSPVFYDLEGNAHPAGMISLNPLEVRHIEISSLLPQSLNNLNRVGGLSLSYNGGMMEVVAQITVFGDGNEGSVDIPFSATMDYRSATQNAVWWMPRNSKSTIILGNATDTAITATLNFSSGDSQNIELAPHASATVEKRANGNQGDTSESVRVTSTGAAGSLRVTGYVRTNDKKSASAIHFYDPQNARQSNLYASNFRVKGMEAFLMLRNLGEAALTATPKFFPTNGTNPVELPAVTIAPQQNLKVNLELLVSAAASRNDLDQVSVQIVSSGAAGNLIGALTSANSARRMTWSVPLRDSGPTRNSTGGYPWKLSDDYNTIVSITNVSERATKYIASLNFTGGTYQPQTRELEPGETVFFDLKKLRDEQTPDKDGRLIPLNVQGGQFHWSKVSGGRETDLIGRTEVTSQSGHVSSSFSCPVCCPDSGPYGYFTPGSLSLSVDGFLATTPLGDYVNCYNWPSYTVPISLSNLGVSDSACLDFAYQSEYRVTGIGPGTAQFSGDYLLTEWDDDGMDCYVFSSSGPAIGNAQVIQVNDVTADGAVRVTSVVGNQNMIHFVTPKGAANENVTLTASITPNDQASADQISWEGATQNPNNRLQATVSKSSATKHTVRVRVNNQTAREIRVWVVWATINAPGNGFPVATQNSTNQLRISGGYQFTHTIMPGSIITDSNRPNLSGVNTMNPPGGSQVHPATGLMLSGGVNAKWDGSRQTKVRTIASEGINKYLVKSNPGLWNH